jgi:hypothetical protein
MSRKISAMCKINVLRPMFFPLFPGKFPHGGRMRAGGKGNTHDKCSRFFPPSRTVGGSGAEGHPRLLRG